MDTTSVTSKKARAKVQPAPALTSEPVVDTLKAHRDEAWALEVQLEEEILRDAVLTARIALEELKSDLHGPPHERRRGIRLREKALKVERAFNRLRALRKGEMLPDRHEDD